MMRDHNIAGLAVAGLLLLGVPIGDLVMGGAFGSVHAILGTMGLAFLVMTLGRREET